MSHEQTYTIHDLPPEMYSLIITALDSLATGDNAWTFIGAERRMQAGALAERLRNDLTLTPTEDSDE